MGQASSAARWLYFFNQFSFVPWPYAGVRGVLNLFSEMARVAQDAFWERGAWG